MSALEEINGCDEADFEAKVAAATLGSLRSSEGERVCSCSLC